MKTAESTLPRIHWQPETLAALEHLRAVAPKTLALQAAESGLTLGEPVLVMIDQAIRYAKAYRAEFDRPLGEDYMAAPELGGILAGIRGLLNFDGAALWEGNHNSGTRRTRDTKDNGMIETLYWKACEIAGLDGDSPA